MGKHSEIEWCTATWNPWYGCRKVSPGCQFCYAERDMRKYGKNFSAVTRAKTTFRDPLKWKEPQRIFTCSWSDFFIEEADAWRDEAWEIIRQTPQHSYMILSKRLERVLAIPSLLPWQPGEQPWPHAWIGTSAEDQEHANRRIPVLLEIPAAVRFVSYEPGLGAITFNERWFRCQAISGAHFVDAIDLIIIGGESARPRSKARPFHLEWAFDALAQCRAAGVPCFVKQLGSNPFYKGKPLRPWPLEDWKGGDMSEWPLEIRVREFPNAQR